MQVDPGCAGMVRMGMDEEQEAAEDERVARDRPADARASQLKVTREARQRDVHRGDVEDHHQLGDEEHGQEPAAPRLRVRGTGVIGLVGLVMHVVLPS